MKITALRLCCLCACLGAGTGFATETVQTAATPSPWKFSLSPYLWVPTATLASNLPDLPPGVPPDNTQHFSKKLSGAFMIAGQIRYGSFGLVADYAWLRLDSQSIQPGPAFSGVDMESNLTHATAVLTWRVPLEGAWRVDLLAGARFWSLSGEQVFHTGALPGFTRSTDRTWTDPTYGADVRYAFGEHWFATGKLLLGGLDSGSAMTEAMAGAGYHFNPSCSLRFGYRYLHEDFSRRGFTWDLEAKGFLVGVDLHF
jgi:hypothetical protein